MTLVHLYIYPSKYSSPSICLQQNLCIPYVCMRECTLIFVLNYKWVLRLVIVVLTFFFFVFWAFLFKFLYLCYMCVRCTLVVIFNGLLYHGHFVILFVFVRLSILFIDSIWLSLLFYGGGLNLCYYAGILFLTFRRSWENYTEFSSNSILN